MAPVARQVDVLSSKYLPLSLELNHWIIYYSTNLNVKWLGQAATEGESSRAAAIIANITSRFFIFLLFALRFSRSMQRITPVSRKVTRIMHMNCVKVIGSVGVEDRSKVIGYLWYIVNIRRLIMMSDCRIASYYKVSPHNYNSHLALYMTK